LLASRISGFYLGQHYRLWGEPLTGLPYLKKAAELTMPERSLFQWHYLYSCLSKLELGRAVQQLHNLSSKELKELRRIMRQADCREGDPGNLSEMNNLLQMINLKIETAKINRKKSTQNSATENGAASSPEVPTVVADNGSDVLQKLLTFFLKHLDDLDSQLSGDDDGIVFYTQLMNQIDALTTYHTALEKEIQNKQYGSTSSCRTYRSSIAPYLKLMKENEQLIKPLIGYATILNKWTALTSSLKSVCR
jgi:hypothetical protein